MKHRTSLMLGITAVVLALLGAFTLSATGQSYIDQLRRPKILNGALTLPNAEQIANNTDDMVDFSCGGSCADSTDLRIDLDGTRPVISSVTDTAVEVSDQLVASGGAALSGAFAFTGSTFDLDPTGALTCDMDANQGITFTTADMDSAFLVQAAAGEDLILLNYSAGTKSIVLGNATDNPAITQLGTGVVSLDNAAIGGGYGSTGCTASTAGVLQCNGAMTTDGALTADSAGIGGGFGSTGCSASNAGVLQCDGNVQTAGNFLAPAGGGLDVSAAGALAIGATTATSVAITPATTITGSLDLDAGATVAAGQSILGDGALQVGVVDGAWNLVLQLGDNAAAQKLSIEDSDDAEVASIDSNGVATFAAGLTVTAGTVSLPTGEVGATEIADITRSVNISLNDWWPCGTADGTLESDDAADAFPDFARGSGAGTAGSHVIQWDVTGGSVDTETVCTTITVPPDYVSGSAFYLTMLDTATNDHEYTHTTLIQTPDSAEDVATAATTLSNGTGASTTTTDCDGATTASDLYTCIFTTEAVTAGAIITFAFASDGTSTEATSLFGAEWRYTATQ